MGSEIFKSMQLFRNLQGMGAKSPPNVVVKINVKSY